MKFIFDSEETNLGRFGFVKRGDVLELTPHEAESVKGDKRFKEATDKKIENHKPGQFVTITAGMSPAERKAADDANAKEKVRLETLAQQNDERKVYVQTIREMTWPQLEAEAARINQEEGRIVIQYDRKKMARPDLMNLILAAKRLTPDEED